MAGTPRKKVKWDTKDLSLLSLNSPYSDAPSVVSTSSLEYINSQLIAHGFVPSPGLMLDGISNSALERVVKCLLGLLSERMDDMARTEELSTKLRTLSYDHDRLLSMHRIAKENAANAEREMNVHKSRYLAAMRSVQAAETAHKQTTMDLYRTRSLLQGIRTMHACEVKKKEKDTERIFEKWSKLVDNQTKLAALPAGIQCANVAVVTGTEVIGKGQEFLELALEEAERARSQLLDENTILKKLILKTINEIQSMMHEACLIPLQMPDEPTPYTLSTLFPPHPVGYPSEQWHVVLDKLRDCLLPPRARNNENLAEPVTLATDNEIRRLNEIITSLTKELERYKQQIIAQNEDRVAISEAYSIAGEMGICPSTSLLHKEKEILESMKAKLEAERQILKEATIELEKERANFKAERCQLCDANPHCQSNVLADVVPNANTSGRSELVYTVYASPKKSRKSGSTARVGKVVTNGRRKVARVPKRSLTTSKVTLSYETEVLPTEVPTDDAALTPSSLLPTSFVLPPPTPHTSLPVEPALNSPCNHLPQADLSQSKTGCLNPSTPDSTAFKIPIAKPLAQRMIHAYSPAKPSPLSRILRLGNSPNSSESGGSGTLENSSGVMELAGEKQEVISGIELGIPTLRTSHFQGRVAPLGAGLEVQEPSSDDLLGKRKLPVQSTLGNTANARNVPTNCKTHKKEKGRTAMGRSGVSSSASQTRNRTSAGSEKENKKRTERKVFSVGASNKSPIKPVVHAPKSKRRPVTTIPPLLLDGPRRVLIDSDETRPMIKARRS